MARPATCRPELCAQRDSSGRNRSYSRTRRRRRDIPTILSTLLSPPNQECLRPRCAESRGVKCSGPWTAGLSISRSSTFVPVHCRGGRLQPQKFGPLDHWRCHGSNCLSLGPALLLRSLPLRRQPRPQSWECTSTPSGRNCEPA